MGKKIKVVVVSPERENVQPIPSLYLLHGYSGNYSNWVQKGGHVQNLVDQYNYMVICPDGGFGSWYWDVPGDKDNQYETFVSKELVDYVESNYKVCKAVGSRGITGLSMGGHGALYLAINHQDVFGAAGSTSGGVDIRPFPNNWEIAKRLGPYSDNKEKWEDHTVMGLLHLLKPNGLKIFIDCGTGDFFYEVNKELHRQLGYRNVPHVFLTMPGAHNWDYWSKSIAYQMAFFDDFFRHN
jgi:S-formylglutathione hydrolase FrmB